MSFVELRVELPAYSRVFNVKIPSNATVINIKQEIYRVCPGNPRIDGQRLVWRGRYLADDERVHDLWKSPDEPCIVHLAVHPSSWSDAPPSAEPEPSTSAPNTPEHFPAMPSYTSQEPQSIQTVFDRLNRPRLSGGNPIEYIQWKHDDALYALLYGSVIPWHRPSSPDTSRLPAVLYVHSLGYEWPTILDEEWPNPTPGGVKYEHLTRDGLPYLSLSASASAPTPFQLHAIKVLSCTFSLLSLTNPPTPTLRPISVNTVPVNVPPDLNALLQQLGLPPLRVQQPQIANPDRIIRELRDVAVRPLLIPLAFLIFRTCLLLYFVAPARKPVFGLLIVAWMLYEIMQPIRNALLRNMQRLEAQQRREGPEDAANLPGGDRQQQRQQPQAPPAANEAVVGMQGMNNAGILVDTLGNMNLDAEQQILNATPGSPLDEPSFWHKSATFLALLVTTLHPAVWDRRRALLRRREGQLRTEANLRNRRVDGEVEGSEGEAQRREARDNALVQHGRRPLWAQRYIERILSTDWLDDAD